MAKKKPVVPARPAADKPATLKDLLSEDTVRKLKDQAEQMKVEQTKLQEEKRAREEEARKAEQKKLESSFEYLLGNSQLDWKNFK